MIRSFHFYSNALTVHCAAPYDRDDVFAVAATGIPCRGRRLGPTDSASGGDSGGNASPGIILVMVVRDISV